MLYVEREKARKRESQDKYLPSVSLDFPSAYFWEHAIFGSIESPLVPFWCVNTWAQAHGATLHLLSATSLDHRNKAHLLTSIYLS